MLVHPSRFERETSGLGRRGGSNVTSLIGGCYILGDTREVDCSLDRNDVGRYGCDNARQVIVSDELFQILVVWPMLPAPIRGGIVAMVRAAAVSV